jgi:hypothetical protein
MGDRQRWFDGYGQRRPSECGFIKSAWELHRLEFACRFIDYLSPTWELPDTHALISC